MHKKIREMYNTCPHRRPPCFLLSNACAMNAMTDSYYCTL